MSLVIAHLHSRFRSQVPLDPARCDAWLSALAHEDGDALTRGLLHADEWLLIRHLPLAMRWRADAADADISLHWRQAMRLALEQASARPDDHDIIRYASRRAALADLLYRSALGERQRQWAWQRMGLIELIPGTEKGAAEVLNAGLTRLVREPELVWPVLHRIIMAEAATAALTALLRALPTSSWQRLLAASPRTAPYAASVAALAGNPTTLAHAEQPAGPLPSTGEAHALLGWVAARPHFAARHSDTLATLIAALAWPTTGGSLHARVAAVMQQLAALTGKRAASSYPTDAISAAVALESAAPAHMSTPVHDTAALPGLPQLPEPLAWEETRWAGSLFWLGRLPASGALSWLEEGGHALPQLLRALATALGVPPDDAALRAFCGGDVPHEDIPAVLTERAAALVADWNVWVDEQAPDLPAPRMTSICQRSGRLRFEAGWIELHLPLDSVDTRIRRLGLDLDPGWLPWLGCVVRIIYDA